MLEDRNVYVAEVWQDIQFQPKIYKKFQITCKHLRKLKLLCLNGPVNILKFGFFSANIDKLFITLIYIISPHLKINLNSHLSYSDYDCWIYLHWDLIYHVE